MDMPASAQGYSVNVWASARPLIAAGRGRHAPLCEHLPFVNDGASGSNHCDGRAKPQLFKASVAEHIFVGAPCCTQCIRCALAMAFPVKAWACLQPTSYEGAVPRWQRGSRRRKSCDGRLRVPLLEEAAGCRPCGASMDAFVEHAFACPCLGDRTLRHTELHNAIFSHACAGG